MTPEIRVAVVTGGGHGIGRAICRRLSREGIAVAVADLEQPAAESVASETGGRAWRVDVGDESQLMDFVNEVENELGPIDLFVSNAGVGFGDGPAGAASAEGGINDTGDRWTPSWQVNVMAHVYAARALVPRMLERGGGYFVNIASAAGLLSQIGDAAYSATKHAAVGFAESLAITHGEDGIHISVVCPQAVATRMIGIEDESESLDGGFLGNDVDGILPPEAVADAIFDGLEAKRFMILPHPQVAEYFGRKAGDYDRWIRGMQKFRRRLLDAE
jgi:NAD(P)-dependent dehydrogenase (short-subunit alcohol dehydrogenase family)